jgi:3-hydroxyisobutyrate dehydrogenase-like beta-hydroxyacid dehydrogenase
MEKEKIGFMGLGIMGYAMALNIAKAGYPLTVYNRTAKDLGKLKSLGVEIASTPESLGAASDVVISMVTGPEAIENLLWGENGAARTFNRDKTFINMSSVSPRYTQDLDRKLAPSGVCFIDAPVSGSKKPAEDAALLILAAGAKDRVEALAPLFATMGKRVVYCGEIGRGSMMKMANNLLLALMIEGLSETLNFGKRGGLSVDSMLEVILNGPLNCPIFQMKCQALTEDCYDPNFPLKHATKDLKFVIDTAFEIGAPVPVAQTLLHLYSTGVNKDWGDLDVCAIMKVLEDLCSA